MDGHSHVRISKEAYKLTRLLVFQVLIFTLLRRRQTASLSSYISIAQSTCLPALAPTAAALPAATTAVALLVE